MAQKDILWGLGRRKTSVARIRLKQGHGKIRVNKQSIDEYFVGHESLRIRIKQPLKLTNTENKYDVYAVVKGGGKTGQAEAIRHGVSRALTLVDENNKIPLRKAGFLTRDPRMVERKKPGQKKARKKFQWTKR